MSTPNGSGLNLIAVDISSAGDNVVIAGLSGGVTIRRIVLALASETTVQFKTSSRVLSGPMTVTSLGLSFSDQAYYPIGVNEDFIISLGDAVQTGGTIWFQRGP